MTAGRISRTNYQKLFRCLLTGNFISMPTKSVVFAIIFYIKSLNNRFLYSLIKIMIGAEISTIMLLIVFLLNRCQKKLFLRRKIILCRVYKIQNFIYFWHIRGRYNYYNYSSMVPIY